MRGRARRDVAHSLLLWRHHPDGCRVPVRFLAVRRGAALFVLPAERLVRRDVRRGPPAARALRRRCSRSCVPRRPDELRARQSEADNAFLTQGITFTVYGDDAGHRADLSLRPAAAHHHRRGVADDRARADAAAHGDQPVPEGHLPRRPHPRRRRRAARAGLQLPPLPPRDARRARAPRHLRLGGRHRSGAAARTAASSCSKTTCACRAACRTCWRTAR